MKKKKSPGHTTRAFLKTGRYTFDDLVKIHWNDGFDCRGVRPDAHYRASATRPYMPGAQKLRSEAHLQE
jgi:hypothetical protein